MSLSDEFKSRNKNNDIACSVNSIQRNQKEYKPIMNCNYTFPIDFAPNRITFGAKSIGESVIIIQI